VIIGFISKLPGTRQATPRGSTASYGFTCG
jgi:hypothetical protein